MTIPSIWRDALPFVILLLPSIVPGVDAVNFGFSGCITTCLGTTSYSTNDPTALCEAANNGLMETLIHCIFSTCTGGLVDVTTDLINPLQTGCQSIDDVEADDIQGAESAVVSLVGTFMKPSSRSTKVPITSTLKPTTMPVTLSSTAATETPAAAAVGAALQPTTGAPLAQSTTPTQVPAPVQTTKSSSTSSTVTLIASGYPSISTSKVVIQPLPSSGKPSSTTHVQSSQTTSTNLPVVVMPQSSTLKTATVAKSSSTAEAVMASSTVETAEVQSTAVATTAEESQSVPYAIHSLTSSSEVKTTASSSFGSFKASSTSQASAWTQTVDTDEAIPTILEVASGTPTPHMSTTLALASTSSVSSTTTSAAVETTDGVLAVAVGTPTPSHTFVTSTSSSKLAATAMSSTDDDDDDDDKDTSDSSPFTAQQASASRGQVSCMFAALPVVAVLGSMLF